MRYWLRGLCVATLLCSATAYANGILPVVGNHCTVDPQLKIKTDDGIALGRLTVTDINGQTIDQQEDVLVTRPDGQDQSCLWQFDIDFTPSLVEELLTQDLFVELELCERPCDKKKDCKDQGKDDGDKKDKRDLDTRDVENCTFEDPARTIVFEPVDTLLGTLATHLFEVLEASCPDGTALQAIDMNGSSQYSCTSPLATVSALVAETAARKAANESQEMRIDDLNTDFTTEKETRLAMEEALQTQIGDMTVSLKTETSARITEDNALLARIDTVSNNLSAETTTRASGDTALMEQIAGKTADIASLAAANTKQQEQLDDHANQLTAHAVDIAQNSTAIVALNSFDNNLAGSCPAGQAVASIDRNGKTTCVPYGNRIVAQIASATASCSYSCNNSAQYPSCSCSCHHDWFGSCTCSCSSTATASCSAQSCMAPPADVGCPDVGGSQGQSALAACLFPSSGFEPSTFKTCQGTKQAANGQTVSCRESRTKQCSCSCSSWDPGNCSCSCQPSGSVSCVSPTKTASVVTARANCLSIE